MSVLINGMTMPQNCRECRFMETVHRLDGRERYICIAHLNEITNLKERLDTCPLVELPDHGDLIDRDEFSRAMYHEAFETDSDWQKWDSGCWIRYKMFERLRNSAPVVIPAERSEEGSLCGECDRMYTQNCSYCERVERSEE